MALKCLLISVSMASLATLSGCAYGGPNEPYGTTYGSEPGAFNRQPDVLYGRVTSIQTVQIPIDSQGVAGTVAGGVLGGVLGHQVGRGNGRTVGTVVGAAAGAFAGNQIQRSAGGIGSKTAYQVTVQLNDGRVATVTQPSENNLRVGDRVMVVNDQVTRVR
ncbi:MAG: glycine zipper 2TM domain-containing protein [Burkholderiaceae bacterium]|nr:glycine zipper 2TM domain-containing protein [Burkholderiaceae bacterium]